MKQIASGASDLMGPIRAAMARATGEIGDVELTTPGDWRELAWAFGLKMQAAQTQSFETLLHGSGVQSVLAYEVLHAIDTTFSGSFGWRKGAVWAVEEPESFLHARLQGELARSFAEYAAGSDLQIFLTTHASAFLGSADEGIVVEIDDSGRSAFEMRPRAEVIRHAYSAGAAPFSHPLHTGPPKPLLLVEGKNDRELVTRAFDDSKLANPYEILCLQDFDPSLSGGDQIAGWLRYQREALEARPETSPVFVLIDWEAKAATTNKIAAELKGHATSRCLQWPADLTNEDLSENWAGVERFLSTEFVEFLGDEGIVDLLVPASSRPAWKYSVDKKQLAMAKADIHSELDDRDDPDDIEPLIQACDWLASQLKVAPPLL